MRLQKILCAVDFSSCSESAVDVAAAFARRDGAELALLYVDNAPTLPMPDGSLVLPPLETLARHADTVTRHLEVLQARATADGAPRITVLTGEGEPWRSIVTEADSGGYDLVVIGTHGRTGLRHFALGSVAERVVRHASCPVLTVREGAVPANLTRDDETRPTPDVTS